MVLEITGSDLQLSLQVMLTLWFLLWQVERIAAVSADIDFNHHPPLSGSGGAPIASSSFSIKSTSKRSSNRPTFAAVSDEFGTRPIWQEEFEELNLNVWEHLVTAWRGGNGEFQYYRNNRKNSYVKDGILYIKPSLTADEYGTQFLYNGTLDLWKDGCNVDIDNGCLVVAGKEIINPIQSARMVTADSFSFKYGRVEIRAKMPKGDWLWPAIWLLPTKDEYGIWPASGEIDMVEARGNEHLFNGDISMGVDRMGSTLHFGPYWPHDPWDKVHREKRLTNGETFASDFHVYGFEWTDNYIRFTLDGMELGTTYPPPGGFWELGEFERFPGGRNPWENGTRMAPFDKEFHFILNMAVGGYFFADEWTNKPHPKPWLSKSETPMKDFWEKNDWWYHTWNPHREDNALQVDYIRVFPWKGHIVSNGNSLESNNIGYGSYQFTPSAGNRPALNSHLGHRIAFHCLFVLSITKLKILS